MNKAIGVAVWALFGLLGCTSAAPVPSPLESEEAHHALALMQTQPVERSGRNNMWATLITAKQAHLTPQQRQDLADDYMAEFNHWYTTTYVDWYLKQDVFKRVSSSEPSSEPKPPTPPGDLQLPQIGNNEALCPITHTAECLNIVREQPQVTKEALAPYADWLEQVAELADYDYYHDPLPHSLPTRIPSFQLLSLPLSAHALSHVNGNSEQALMGLCRDANTARVLLNESNHLIAVMVGASVLRRNLHVAAQIIAELPLETPLPASCDTAFAPLTAQEINQSLCSGMRSEHTAMSAFIELVRKQLEQQILPENASLANLDNVLLVDAQYRAPACEPQMQQALLKDEKFSTPPIETSISTWLQQCSKHVKHSDIPYGIACGLSQTVVTDYTADYVHRIQDTAAQLQMMQVLLWLRQQPGLPQPLTHDYLQSAVPTNLYSSVERPLTLSEDGSDLKIPAYEKRPRDPCACVRLPVPQALRDAH